MDASFSLKVLHLAGLDPRDNSRFARIKSFVTFITAFIICVTSLMGITEWQVDVIVPAMEAFVGGTQVNRQRRDFTKKLTCSSDTNFINFREFCDGISVFFTKKEWPKCLKTQKCFGILILLILTMNQMLKLIQKLWKGVWWFI